MPSTRRDFLATTPAVAASLAAMGKAATAQDLFREFLRPHVLKKDTLDQFLDPKAQVWARYDSELGYLLRNSFVRDGVDGCHTLARYQPTGQRQQVNFPTQPSHVVHLVYFRSP